MLDKFVGYNKPGTFFKSNNSPAIGVVPAKAGIKRKLSTFIMRYTN